MNVFDLMIWAQKQELREQQRQLRRRIDDSLAAEKEGQAEFEAEMYKSVARDHLISNGQAPEDELVGQMSSELADAIKNRTYEWKRPLPETLNLGDDKQMDEILKNFDLHMHDVLEQLGYGAYNSEQ